MQAAYRVMLSEELFVAFRYKNFNLGSSFKYPILNHLFITKQFFNNFLLLVIKQTYQPRRIGLFFFFTAGQA